MATVTFDTLKFVKTLESAGMPAEQAEAVSSAVRDAHDAASLVTKQDLEIALAPMRSEQILHRWMLGLLIAGVGAIFAKLFF